MRYQRGIVCAMTAALCLASGCVTRSYAPTTDAATHELKIRAGDEIRVVEPNFSANQWLATYPMTDERQKERLAQALLPLGL